MPKIKKNITPVINSSNSLQPTLPFHELFPVHLNYKDGDEIKDCYFKDEVDLKKHLKRYNIKKFTVTETQPKQ